MLLEQATQHVIYGADAICRGIKRHKVQVSLEGKTNHSFLQFFSIHRALSLSFCLVLGEQ